MASRAPRQPSAPSPFPRAPEPRSVRGGRKKAAGDKGSARWPSTNAETEARAIMDAIREIVRVLRESSRAAEAEVGLSGAQLFVLRQLADGGPMSLNEVAARTLTHQSSVSVVVSRLVDGGLVSRTRSGEDSRRLELALTHKGEALLRQAPGASQERLIDGLRGMSVKERRQLRLALDRWLQEVGVKERIPVMFFEDEPPRPRRKR